MFLLKFIEKGKVRLLLTFCLWSLTLRFILYGIVLTKGPSPPAVTGLMCVRLFNQTDTNLFKDYCTKLFLYDFWKIHKLQLTNMYWFIYFYISAASTDHWHLWRCRIPVHNTSLYICYNELWVELWRHVSPPAEKNHVVDRCTWHQDYFTSPWTNSVSCLNTRDPVFIRQV